MESYCGNNKPYIYLQFHLQCETEVEEYLQPLLSKGALFYRGYTLSKDEKKRIEGAHALLLFVIKENYVSDCFREVVDYAVESGKKILVVYLEAVEADAWGRMQLNSYQSMFRWEYDNEEDFTAKLKEAEIFRNMAVTPQQKKYKRMATLSTWIFILIIAGFIYLIVSSPKIIQLIEEKQVETSIVGLEGMTQKDLDEVQELFIVGDNVYVGRNQDPFQYDHGVSHIRADERGHISDMSEIRKCHNLRKLTIISNNITDITPITEMTSLISLNLNDNPIESIEGIENLTELMTLSLEDTYVSDLTPIENLDKLISLNLAQSRVSELPDNGLLEHIVSLDVIGTEVRSIPYLGNGKMNHLGLDELEKREGYLDFLKDKESFDLLSFNHADIDDLAKALQGKTVEDFGDSGIDISSVHDLEPLCKIVKHNLCLNAHENLTTLAGVEAFEGIECMSIYDCDNLTDLSAIRNVSSIRVLSAASELRPLIEEQLRGKELEITYDWDK